MPILEWVDTSEQGIARTQRGRGFAYLDIAGRRVTDSDELERILSWRSHQRGKTLGSVPSRTRAMPVIQGPIEEAVLDLLEDESPAAPKAA